MEKSDLPNPPDSANASPAPTEKKKFWQFNSGHPKSLKWLLAGLVELLLLIGVFSLGMNVGFHKANFTYSWVSHYPKNFNLPVGLPPAKDFFNPHGVFGQILTNNNGSSLIIKDSDGNEKTILVSPGVTIRQNYQNLQPDNLKDNEQIIIIGDPNSQGQIQARFIRVLGQSN